MAKSKAGYWLTEDGLILLKDWARNGLTDEQIAERMNIGVRTLYEYKNKYQQISQALKETKEICDSNVENALYKAACEGNTTAMIFWMKNRRRWRDNPPESTNEAALTKATELLGDVESAID